MIEVTVKRGQGARPAERIVERLLTGSWAALAARAESELAAYTPDARTADLDIRPDPAIRKGMVVLVLESGTTPRTALVRRVTMTESAGNGGAVERSMTLTVEYR